MDSFQVLVRKINRVSVCLLGSARVSGDNYLCILTGTARCFRKFLDLSKRWIATESQVLLIVQAGKSWKTYDFMNGNQTSFHGNCSLKLSCVYECTFARAAAVHIPPYSPGVSIHPSFFLWNEKLTTFGVGATFEDLIPRPGYDHSCALITLSLGFPC